MRKRFVIVLTVAAVAVTAWLVYATVNPPESFYRKEYQLATGMLLPESAELIEGRSEWGMTAAVFRIPAEEWPLVAEPLIDRVDRDGGPATVFSKELLASLGEEAHPFVLSTDRRKVVISLDSTRRCVFWEVWHG